MLVFGVVATAGVRFPSLEEAEILSSSVENPPSKDVRMLGQHTYDVLDVAVPSREHVLFDDVASLCGILFIRPPNNKIAVSSSGIPACSITAVTAPTVAHRVPSFVRPRLLQQTVTGQHSSARTGSVLPSIQNLQ